MTTGAPAGDVTRAAAWRRWLAGRTLRTRLIAGLLLLFTLSCVGVGLVTTIALQRFLVGQLDQQVMDAHPLVQTLEHDNPAFGEPSRSGASVPGPNGVVRALPAGLSSATFAARLVNGRVVAAGTVYPKKGLLPMKLTAQDTKVLLELPVNSRPYTRRLRTLGEYRLMAAMGDADVHITGLPLHNVESTVRQMEVVEAIVFGAALLIVGLAGAGWIRLALRPLRRMTATAAEVTELPLASGEVALPHRVLDADPRTEVGQLGSAFNRMLGHVEGALAQRQASAARLRQFVADASHELRTPLAGIRGHTELALRAREPLPHDVSHALNRVAAESLRMSRLVDDLLLLARLDAGRPLADETVDLTRLAIDATNDARVAGPDHRWLLDLPDEPVTVHGDELRLHQVMANLLTNARAHTPAGTTVSVRLSPADVASPVPARGALPGRGDTASCEGHPAAPDGSQPAAGLRPADPDGPTVPAPPTPPGAPEGLGMVELTVTDDGPGIPAELQATVFERFVRGDSGRSRVAGSTGLGLSIAHAVVSAHHGSLSLTSTPGRTTLRIRLPADRRDETDPATQPAPVFQEPLPPESSSEELLGGPGHNVAHRGGSARAAG